MVKKKGKQKRRLYILRNQKKLFRNRRKKAKVRIYNQSSTYVESGFLGSDYERVIEHLDANSFFTPMNKSVFNRDCEIIGIPSTFSISENTEEVIKKLREIYTILKTTKARKIIFNHAECTNLGLSASTIMDIIVLATEKYREKMGKYLELEGSLPRDKRTRDVLLASGLPYHLNAETRMSFDEDNVQRFETIKGRHDIEANKAGETATNLTLYLDKCLKTQGMEFNAEGKRLLSRILGEVISNCEIHGGELATWYTQGHYQVGKGNSFGEMQLLFLNLGETIYEGLKHSSSDETKGRLTHISEKHKRYMNESWNEEMLYTVFALQEGISRLRDSKIEGYELRGSGTVSMIEMFNAIGESESGLKPQMTIISGRTKISFSDQYTMKTEMFNKDEIFGTGERQIIAFNGNNDIYTPADPKNVIRLKENFPGTVISLKFYLDGRYIIKKRERENH